MLLFVCLCVSVCIVVMSVLFVTCCVMVYCLCLSLFVCILLVCSILLYACVCAWDRCCGVVRFVFFFSSSFCLRVCACARVGLIVCVVGGLLCGVVWLSF